MKNLFKFLMQVAGAILVIYAMNHNKTKNTQSKIDFEKIGIESNIATQSSSYWQEQYDKAKYYYNDYRTNSLLQTMYNMQAEYLVKMSCLCIPKLARVRNIL